MLWPCVAMAQQVTVGTPQTGRLRGVAYDSVHAAPLNGALIQLVSATDPSRTRSITADAQGRFEFDSLSAGTWLVGALHPQLDLLAIEQLSTSVVVKAKGTTRATLAVPSTKTLVTKVCGADVARDSAGYVHGMLRSARNMGVGAPGSVNAQWVEFSLARTGLVRTPRRLEVRSTAEGSYVACGVPVGETIRMRAWSGADSTGVLDVNVPPQGILRMDLAIGEARRVMVPVATLARSVPTDTATDSLRATEIEVLRGDGRLRGAARRAGEQPLANAKVTVRGSGLETSTAEDGSFSLSGLPTGSYLLEMRAIGFEPLTKIVDVIPDAENIVSATLDRLIMMDTVQVRAMRMRMLGPQMVGFDERRRRGFGKFLGPDELEKMFAAETSDLFRMMPGVRVVPGNNGNRVMMRGDHRGYCQPTVFIDGTRLSASVEFNDLNSYVFPADIRAIEAYTTSITAPPEYSNGFSNCGSIVIWTGSRR